MVTARAAAPERGAGSTRDGRSRHWRTYLSAALAVVLVAAAVALWAILSFVGAERDRDVAAVETRLGIVAGSRVQAVDGWLRGQFAIVSSVAGNPGVQILLGTYPAAGADDAITDPMTLGQIDQARTLLDVSARREGFVADSQSSNGGEAISGASGLAIYTLDGRPIVATGGMPPLQGPLGAMVMGAPRGAAITGRIFPGPDGRPTLAVAAPVFGVQMEPSADAQIGWAVGVKPADGELYPLLAQPGSAEASAVGALLTTDGSRVVNLSPLPGGISPFGVAPPAAGSAPALAIAAPGTTGRALDHRGVDVLFASAGSSVQPGWVVLYQVDAAEALAAAEARHRDLLVGLLFALGFALAALVAAWLWGTTRRARLAAERYRIAAEALDRKGRMLSLVMHAQPTAIFILDRDSRIASSNHKLAQLYAVEETAHAAHSGKPLDTVIGASAAAPYVALHRHAHADLSRQDRQIEVLRRDGAATLHIVAVPLPDDSECPGGTLFTVEDVTELHRAQRRRERMLQDLVHTLVGLVDRRDPYSANHSRQVAMLSAAVARVMQLPPHLVETARIAGEVLNLGKMFVGEEILTRSGKLSAEEQAKVRESLLASADIVDGVEFDGPVCDTLRQVQEHVDGTGYPMRLAGDAILPTARIVAVANAYVAMVSPRSYREGLSPDAAIRALLQRVDQAYDVKVVAALVTQLGVESRGERAEPAAAPPRDAG